MATQADTDAAILAAYAQANADLVDAIVRAVAAVWATLTAWRAPDIDGFVRRVVPIVAGGQSQMAAITQAYLAAVRQAELGVPSRPAALPATRLIGAAVRAGVQPAEVYHRAGVQVWTDLAGGKPLADAVQAGLDRALLNARTDLQLTKTRTAAAVLDTDDRATGYRRVLNGASSCALCVVASTQRYHKRDLLPIHPGCDCSVEQFYADEDVQVIDEDLLRAAHQAIRDKFGISDASARAPDYRKLILVREHGEYGPTLTVAGHHFTDRQAALSRLDLTGLPGRSLASRRAAAA